MSVAENVAGIVSRIRDAEARAGRAPGSVRLVAVSKKQPMERLHEAYDAGLRVFGENYVQELERKRPEMPDDVEWHLVGHLQSNKAKKAASMCKLVHSVGSEKLGRALGEVPFLLEVNLGGEESKSGVAREEVAPLARALAGPSLRGLMCIPPPGASRPYFAELRALRDRLEKDHGLSLPELSMGMSDDFEDAILEGATLVRVGTALFGTRV